MSALLDLAITAISLIFLTILLTISGVAIGSTISRFVVRRPKNR